MGLQDRDYAGAGRAPWGGGGLGMGGERFFRRGPRAWSVNTWIIVVCVVVFVIDALVAASAGPIQTDMGKRFLEGVTREQMARAVVVEGELKPSLSLSGAAALLLVDPETRQIVGEQRYVYMSPLQAALHFSTDRALQRFEIWRFVGFQFLHAGAMHLLFNMIGMFFFGPLVEHHLGRRRYLTFYLLAGACGALLYLLLNLVGQFSGLRDAVPGALSGDINSPLIGASAGVFGVLMAAAYVAPNATVLFMFIIPMRMRTLIYLLVGLAVFYVLTSGPNAGGEAAHLGGAIAGFFLVRRPGALNRVAGWFDFSRREPRKPKPTAAAKPKAKGPDEAEVDRILAKVANEGLPSLTDRERKTLHRATEAKRR